MKVGSMFVVTVPSGFELEAKKEIERLIPHAKVRSLFFKGNLLLESPLEAGVVIARLKGPQTTYIGRVFPVDSKLKISPNRESIARLRDHVLLLGRLGNRDTFLVRCKRRGSHDFSSQEVERELGSFLEKDTGAIVNLEAPIKIVIVQIFQNLAFVGVTESENVLIKRVQVSRKYAKGERPFTRAEHKIKEAIEAFDFGIKPEFEVLDIGAAPGGWTKVLASLAKRVVAVDPADLDPSVAALPNVTHLKIKAEDIPHDMGQFDLVTNDMNLSPTESANIMVDLAHCLRKGRFAIMTVKFITRDRKKHLSDAIRILETEYKNFQTKKLPHNRYEKTLFMQKM